MWEAIERPWAPSRWAVIRDARRRQRQRQRRWVAGAGALLLAWLIASHSPSRPAATAPAVATGTAAGSTWLADELDGVGTFAPSSHHVAIQRIDWAGQPVDIATVATGAGRIWALGEASVPTPKNLDRTLDIVTAIDPATHRIIRQWSIPGANSIVFADGTPYIGTRSTARVIRLSGLRPQILALPRPVASLTAATPQALWATTRNGQLMRIKF